MSEKKLVGNTTFFKCDECRNFKPLHDMTIVHSREDCTFCRDCWKTLGAIHKVKGFLLNQKDEGKEREVLQESITKLQEVFPREDALKCEELLKELESVIDDNDITEEKHAWCFPINAEMRDAPPAGHRCPNCGHYTIEEHGCDCLEDDDD